MKQLKFEPHLAELILTGQKTATWRINDDKDLTTGDQITFVDSATLEPFATATITETIMTTFDMMSDSDKVGHEPYPNDEAMLAIFAAYYHQPVTLDTPVKIARFELSQKLV